MRSRHLALLWLTWGRHRWGLAAVAVGLAGLCCLQNTLPGEIRATELGVTLATVPLAFVFVYLAFVFSCTEVGGRGRGSSFPSWQFPLPARTSLLVVWPMLSGATAFALVWIAAARFLFWPAELDVFMWWPALGMAATIMWLQAVDWSPLGLGVKAVLAVGVMAGLWLSLLKADAALDHALLLTGSIVMAYVVAVFGVSRARRGGLTAGTGWRNAVERILAVVPRRQQAFSSPAAAQFWFEWRRNGILLPGLMACCLLFVAVFVPFAEPFSITIALLTNVYLVASFAPLVGCAFGKPDMLVRPLGMTHFRAARPMTSGSVAVAKLQAAALGLIIAWGMLAATIFIWLIVTDSFGDWVRLTQPLLGRSESVHPALLVGLAIVSLIGFSAVQMGGHFFAALSGRVWVVAGVVLVYLVVVPNLFALHLRHKDSSPELYLKVIDLMPALVRLAVALKLVTASGAFYIAWRRGMMTWPQILGIAAVWLFVVVVIVSLIKLVFPPEASRFEYVVLGVVLALPLTRLAAAPHALAWNRHR